MLLSQCAPECAPPPPAVHWSVDWNRVAWCESGGNWSMHVTTRYGTFGGGLAFEVSPYDTWSHFGGDRFASQPWLASKAAQIVVAERVLAAVGRSAWDCL
jgi:hypothetical protein